MSIGSTLERAMKCRISFKSYQENPYLGYITLSKYIQIMRTMQVLRKIAKSERTWTVQPEELGYDELELFNCSGIFIGIKQHPLLNLGFFNDKIYLEGRVNHTAIFQAVWWLLFCYIRSRGFWNFHANGSKVMQDL